MSRSDVTSQGGASAGVLHHRQSVRAQHPMFAFTFLFAFHHPACLGGSKHVAIARRAAICAGGGTTTAMDSQRVGGGRAEV